MINENQKPLITFGIVPEPHISNRNKENRIDYVGEIKDYMKDVFNILSKYKDDNLVPTFAGDIFDRGFRNLKGDKQEDDMREFSYWNTYFLDLRAMSWFMATLIGNHETSFPVRNPFWYLLKDVPKDYSERFHKKSIQPKGQLDLLRVMDSLKIDESAEIYFGHHGYFPKPNPKNKLNILITHNDIVTTKILNIMEEKYDRDLLSKYVNYVNLDDNNILDGYDFVFVGHMHTAFGRFLLNNPNRPCIIQYLGSLGRTNETEVNDKDLLRYVPILKIYKNNQNNKDTVSTQDTQNTQNTMSDSYDFGSLTLRIINEEIHLKPRLKVLDMTRLEQSKTHKDTKELKQLYKEFIESEPQVEDPITSLRETFKNPLLKQIFNGCLDSEMPDIITDIISKAHREIKVREE